MSPDAAPSPARLRKAREQLHGLVTSSRRQVLDGMPRPRSNTNQAQRLGVSGARDPCHTPRMSTEGHAHAETQRHGDYLAEMIGCAWRNGR